MDSNRLETLINVQFLHRLNKVQLYNLYVSLKPNVLSPISTFSYKAAKRASKLASLNITILPLYKAIPFMCIGPWRQAFCKPEPLPRLCRCKTSLDLLFHSACYRSSSICCPVYQYARWVPPSLPTFSFPSCLQLLQRILPLPVAYSPSSRS